MRRRKAAWTLESQVLVLVTLALTAFGLVMVYSATSAAAALGDSDPSYYLKRQGVYALTGVALLIVAARVDFRLLRRFAPVLVLVALALCAAVLVLAPPVNGARRWLTIGPGTFQPSELAKLAFVVWAAAYLCGRRAPQSLRELARPFALVTGAFAALIILEPDLGTTISLLVTAGALLAVAGVPVRVLAGACAVAAALGAAAIWMEEYRRERFLIFLDPWSDPHDSGFQTIQALIGIGSGGLFGEGIGAGVQKVFYLPEAHTDMIFAIVGEELGLIGTAGVVSAYGAFAWAGLRIASSARDPFGKLLAVGLTALVCGQAAINLAAVLAIAPLTGIPLPFLSYGGSNLVVQLASVGVLLNIAARGAAVGATAVRDRRGGDGGTRRAGARGRRRAARAGRPRDVRRIAAGRSAART